MLVQRQKQLGFVIGLAVLLLIGITLLEIHPCRPSSLMGWAVLVGLGCPLYVALELLGDWPEEKRCRGMLRVVRFLLWAVVAGGMFYLFNSSLWLRHQFRC